MSYYIGADLGTSALKLLLVDQSGQICRTVTRSYPVSYPRPGWSEQEPALWWEAFTAGIRELISGVSAIRGLALGGQMHGLVVLDEQDRVIRPAILWNDGRTQAETDFLNRHPLSDYTGNIAFAGFTAPKLLWMRANEPELFAKIKKIMLPKDYINYRLTGVHATDFSDASGMLLLDVQNKCWSPQMLELCGISEEQLPRLFESFQPIGGLMPQVAAELGLPAGLPIMAGAGDNAAAAVGTGTVAEGRCNISLGTSGTVFISSDRFAVDPHNALHSFCHADGGYHRMGCILSAASCNKWFCEEILKTADYAAEQAPISDEKLGNNDVFFLPYLMGERSPINDTDARGTFTGLRMDTARADLVQAVLEGVAFAIRDNLEVSGIRIGSSSLCGGGAKSALWQKILCNVLNISVTLPQTEQGPGYGAALLAMVGTGAFETVRECADRFVKIKTTLQPDPEIAARYEQKYQKYRKIYPAMKALFQEIKGGNRMIKQILFDCGGVFTRMEFRETMLRISQSEEIADYFFKHIWAEGSPWHRYDLGELNDGEIAGELKKFMPAELHRYLEPFVANWLDALPPRDGMEPILDALQQKGYPCYLLSNFPVCFREMPERVPLLKRLDKIILSSEVHLLKPDPAIFRYAAEALGVRPEETLFIDDSAANLEGAQAVGFQTYLFTEPQPFADYLIQNHILGEECHE